jgi:GntR family transcriptional repressor for pyruvate dehydrogenase complex
MGVSRVTIRSAIQKLSSLGLVESRHGEGTYVCSLNGTQCFNSMLPMIVLSTPNRESLHEFRTIIESACAMLAAQRITAEQLEELRKCNVAMEENQDDPEKAASYDMAFHKGIANATGNPYIIQVFDILETIFTRSLVENIHLMGASSGVHFHNEICHALELHDSSLAQSRMQEHLKVTHETMIRLLEKQP